MPTADQLIAWGTTLLIVLTGIVDAYRKWRAAHGAPSDEVARLWDENAWLWQEVVRLRHLLGEAQADEGAGPALVLDRGGAEMNRSPAPGAATTEVADEDSRAREAAGG